MVRKRWSETRVLYKSELSEGNDSNCFIYLLILENLLQITKDVKEEY